MTGLAGPDRRFGTRNNVQRSLSTGCEAIYVLNPTTSPYAQFKVSQSRLMIIYQPGAQESSGELYEGVERKRPRLTS
jgi:hypothetical protein